MSTKPPVTNPEPTRWGVAKDVRCNGPVKVQGPAYPKG